MCMFRHFLSTCTGSHLRVIRDARLRNADKEAWRKVIEQSVKPRRDATGVRPLDVQLMQALTSYEVSFSLIPLPAKVKPEPKPKGRWQEKGSWEKGWEPRIPAQIRELGGTASTPAGKRVCFDYSLGKCSAGADGSTCAKGVHVCAKCYGPHALTEHERS